MRTIKNYEDFLNEKINLKKTLGTAALGVGLALSNPSFAGNDYKNDRVELPGDTIKTLGLDEKEMSSKVILFPNPCRDVINAEISIDDEVLNVYIFSINGDLVKHLKPGDFGWQDHESYVGLGINIENLSPGIYLFVVETNKYKVTKKFVKK